MRVALFIGKLGGGGAERQIVHLANGLCERNHDVEIWVYEPDGDYASFLNPAVKQRALLGAGSRRGFLKRFISVWRMVSNTDVDVIHPYLEECCFFTALVPRAKGRKLVFGVRNSGFDRKASSLQLWVLDALSRMTSRRADLVIFNSEIGALRYPRGRASARLIIPNGIDTERFRPPSGPSEEVELRGSLGFPLSKPLLLFVGRDSPKKGLPDLFELVRRVAAGASECTVVIGGVPASSVPADLLAHPKVMHFARLVEPELYMRVANVLVSTSLFGEGFQNVIAEGMSSGCAVVATRVGSAEEIIGELGVICEPGDIKSLVAAVETSLATRRSYELMQKRYDSVVARFGLKELVDRTESALLEAMKVARG